MWNSFFRLLGAAGFLLAGCNTSTQPVDSESSFRFTVIEAWYHASPAPNVVAAGTVEQGTVRVGDEVIVCYDGGADRVKVIAILGEEEALQQAVKGQGAGLRLKVSSEEQYRRWTTMQIVGQTQK